MCYKLKIENKGINTMNLIDTTKELKLACKILKKQKVIAIDCEFIREKTYYPLPCLIQVGYEDGAFLIDSLAKDIDYTDFFNILQNTKIMKVFHSGRQDIEILYKLSGKIPTPVFDTQIAAQVCGLGECVSYENLVRVYCSVDLDKSCRLTNWQIRPLSEKQLEYAANDVIHLVKCYNKINAYLKENHREKWILDDMADLLDISHYDIDVNNAWLRIKHNSHSTQFLNVLKSLAAWRETRAMSKNVTRQNVMKDDLLLNIATSFPKTIEELKQVRGMRSDIIKGVYATEILELLNSLSEEDFDKNLSKQDKEKDVNLTANQQSLYEILKLLLKIKSNEHGVVAHLITSEKNLRKYVKNPKAKNQILKGWRYEIFGKVAEEFGTGKLSITYSPEKHNVVIQ